jgi:hypothetical protein
VKPGRGAAGSSCTAIALLSQGAGRSQHSRMSSKPGTQDRSVPPETAADSAGNADASPPALPEHIYEQATARLAAIIDEWQKARDALRG